MKLRLNDLKLGEIVEAEVIDVMPSRELLLEVSGDLVRVANETNRPFIVGTRLKLKVTAIKPPRFQLVERKHGHYDVSI